MGGNLAPHVVLKEQETVLVAAQLCKVRGRLLGLVFRCLPGGLYEKGIRLNLYWQSSLLHSMFCTSNIQEFV